MAIRSQGNQCPALSVNSLIYIAGAVDCQELQVRQHPYGARDIHDHEDVSLTLQLCKLNTQLCMDVSFDVCRLIIYHLDYISISCNLG